MGVMIGWYIRGGHSGVLLTSYFLTSNTLVNTVYSQLYFEMELKGISP